jgi:hypothetical protein
VPGLIVRNISFLGITVTSQVAVLSPAVAVTVAVPSAIPVTSPVAASTVAIFVLLLVHGSVFGQHVYCKPATRSSVAGSTRMPVTATISSLSLHYVNAALITISEAAAVLRKLNFIFIICLFV